MWQSLCSTRDLYFIALSTLYASTSFVDTGRIFSIFNYILSYPFASHLHSDKRASINEWKFAIIMQFFPTKCVIDAASRANAIAKKIKTPGNRSFVSGDGIAFIVRSGERSRLRRDSTYKSARAFPSYQHCKLIMREERRGARRRKKKHLCDPMTPSGY